MRVHAGRGWSGTAIEDECPCPKAPCGLVDLDNISEECTEHPFSRTKTLRQGHPAWQCPEL